MYFKYGETEINYLKSKDKRLGEIIDKIGYIECEIDPDLFSSVIHKIIGQQVSAKAQITIWERMQDALKLVNAENILNAGVESLQSLGMSFRKAEYITDFARKVQTREFDLDSITEKSDEDAITELVKLKGVGRWTAEMLLLFTLGRPNVFSFDDFAIKRGLRMIYHHREITTKLFEKYRRRFSPYASTASLYIWEVSGGAIPGMKDYAIKPRKAVNKHAK